MKMLEPITINGMKVPNRIMVPAMVTRLSGEDGHVTKEISDRYVRYAAGEVGLIVVEAMAIDGNKAGPLLRINEDRFIPGLAEMNRKIHDTSDSKVVPQLIHFLKISKSGWRQTVDMLSQEDIDNVVKRFGEAAARAREAGFDGIELHNAHAYTLASFVSRVNPRRDEYGGDTLEGRLRLIGRVMASVRQHVGNDFPVGIRYLSEEFVRGGYTVEDAKLIGLRMAQLGADYLSLSVGGKLEDAEHVPGHVKHAYSGYSGERCMPGYWFPPALHAHLGAEIKAFINAKGYHVPVIAAGKMSDPAIVEKVLSEGQLDMVAIARGLLADPDWVKKVRLSQIDRIVKCDYCNVCKQLDGTHMPVNCFLWPKGAVQAPAYDPDGKAPYWKGGNAGLSVTQNKLTGVVSWSKPEGSPVYYDIYRTEDDGTVSIVDAVKVTRWVDPMVMAGRRYRYYVRACDATGNASPPSETVVFEPTAPDFAGPVRQPAVV
ncbi:MAG: NADH:flavin oxidoreductase [Xanthobacteraceae bacterium]|nr:MAG: NADH:flavin oxidoreductase [Xanthobacteraceae bacterium]